MSATREPLTREACAAALGSVWRADSARWVTLPGDDRQHTSGGNCPCQPVQADNGAWDHQ